MVPLNSLARTSYQCSIASSQTWPTNDQPTKDVTTVYHNMCLSLQWAGCIKILDVSVTATSP